MLCCHAFPLSAFRHGATRPGWRKGGEVGLTYRRPRTQTHPAASFFQSGAISEVIDVFANWEVSKQLRCATGYKSSFPLITL